MVTAEPIFLINCLQQLQSCSLRSLKISFVPAGKLSRYVFHNSSLSTFTSNKCVASFCISSKCFCKAFLNIINPSIFCTSSFLYLIFNCFYRYILRLYQPSCLIWIFISPFYPSFSIRFCLII